MPVYVRCVCVFSLARSVLIQLTFFLLVFEKALVTLSATANSPTLD